MLSSFGADGPHFSPTRSSENKNKKKSPPSEPQPSKTWIVDIAFRFSLRTDSEVLTNKEIKTCLVRRLTAGGIQAHDLRVVRGKEQKQDFIDLGGLSE